MTYLITYLRTSTYLLTYLLTCLFVRVNAFTFPFVYVSRQVDVIKAVEKPGECHLYNHDKHRHSWVSIPPPLISDTQLAILCFSFMLDLPLYLRGLVRMPSEKKKNKKKKKH